MSAIHSVTNEASNRITVIIENPPFDDVLVRCLAKGAAATKMQVDTDDLRVLSIRDCDDYGGRCVRTDGMDAENDPLSKIVLLEVRP